MEKAYTSKEISTTLSIGDSTLRKWCLSLEKNGYHFTRNEQNRRVFLEKDIVVLKHFQTLVQENNMPMDNAGNVIVSRFGNDSFESSTPTVTPQKENSERSIVRSDEVIEKLMLHIERQDKFNNELLERLDKQQQYIDERLGERDNALLQGVRELQETKQQLAASIEDDKKKGFWARLLGK